MCLIVGLKSFIIAVSSGSTEMVLTWILFIAIAWPYYAFQESSEAQATIGKKMMSLRVVGMDGERISFARATGRYFAQYVSLLTAYIGYSIQPFTEKR